MATSDHRKAPRRAVEQISRTGSWGDVKYHHALECGHVEVRPRATRAPVLACVSCLRAAEKAVELQSFATQTQPNFEFDAKLAASEIEVARLTAGLAKALRISADAIDVKVLDTGGALQVKSAVVFLSPADVRRLIEGMQA